jgi:pre-mRNA-processing factor 6
MKSAKLEWCLGKLDSARELLEKSIRLYPDYEKFHMMQGQIAEQQNRYPDAIRIYTEGTIRCPLRLKISLVFYFFN